MELKLMTLDGSVDRERFFEEWKNSDQMDATYLVTETAVYMMPYGHKGSANYSQDLKELGDKKFAGTYRRHIFVKRDFEITDGILGGGYLRLFPWKDSCFCSGGSKDFDREHDRGAVEDLVNREFFGREVKS